MDFIIEPLSLIHAVQLNHLNRDAGVSCCDSLRNLPTFCLDSDALIVPQNWTPMSDCFDSRGHEVNLEAIKIIFANYIGSLSNTRLSCLPERECI